MKRMAEIRTARSVVGGYVLLGNDAEVKLSPCICYK